MSSMQSLKCPYCVHQIEFKEKDAGVAALALVSHLERRHEFRGKDSGAMK